MKTLIADTNIFLRFLTNDLPSQAIRVKEIFYEAEKGRLRILVLPITIVEILYQLQNWYDFSKVSAVEKLMSLFSPGWIELDNKDRVIEALEKYKDINIDFVDILTWAMAKAQNVEILSFDKDFDKLTPKLRRKP